MHFESRSHYSSNLGREMEFNVYGHGGKIFLVFPSSGGSPNEYADFGMVSACQTFIDQGLVTFYTPNSFDNESWLAKDKSPHEMAAAHDAYDRYIVEELVPLIKYERNYYGALGVTGCSMGAFHAVNFALRHPDVFDTVIAQSGVYDARFFTGDYYGDELVYHNSPVDYLWNLADSWFLDQYRQNDYIICIGQGAWEEVADTRKLEEAFNTKQIPAWFDYWGFDVDHDWPWWRKQMPYFLTELRAAGKL
ncbi:esterase family protein [Ligilactobacillus agilis]|uniref:esterase family protein n=1 Tax=Ligilactobacillus agilis TaxID=1601 RepID=UPI0019580355|nr:alpha/beta hydrolase-fold protein [Ligilactobacillus agilis]MBM6772033.1 esterase family protein [Ligilactobacillus agilis]